MKRESENVSGFKNKKKINRSDQNITTVANKRETTASADDGWMRG